MFTTENLASTRKHSFSFQHYTPAWKKVISITFSFSHNNKINFLYTVVKLTKLRQNSM